MAKEIILIAAAGENNALGKKGGLLWHLPDDFKRFKQLTTGHSIIMGRKTFETFPKPLPNRHHVIITRQKNYTAAGCDVVNSLEEALLLTQKQSEVYVIGGGEIYALALPFASKIELTRVHHRFEGDAFFPEFSLELWLLKESVFHAKDNRHEYDFTFLTYQKS